MKSALVDDINFVSKIHLIMRRFSTKVGDEVGKTTQKAIHILKIEIERIFLKYGGDSGIRTHDALLAHTPLAGEHLQPLGHVSFRATNCCDRHNFSISKLRFSKSKSCMQSSNSKFHIFIL